MFVEKNFSLRLFLNCSYFSSDFSLNVLIKFVLIKKKECTHLIGCFRVKFARSVFDQKWPIYVSGEKMLLNRCIRICVTEIELSTRKGEPYLASFVRILF